MELKESGDARVHQSAEGIPTVQLGGGGVGISDLFAYDSSFAGVALALVGGSDDPQGGSRPVDAERIFLQIISTNPESIQMLIDKLEIAQHHLGGNRHMAEAIRMVSAERRRQVHGEGFDAAHDAQYGDQGTLISAATCYARNAMNPVGNLTSPPHGWPWDAEWWKPKSPLRDLVKAAALLLAEIERLQRVGARKHEGEERS